MKCINNVRCVCVVPMALRVNGPTNGLGQDGHPPLLSPSQVSLGPQGQGYRTSDLGDNPGELHIRLPNLGDVKHTQEMSACCVPVMGELQYIFTIPIPIECFSAPAFSFNYKS